MKCYECTSKLSDYIDNKLTEQEQNDVERHLKDCPSCSEALVHLQYMLENISALKEVDMPASLHKDIMAKIYKEIKQEKKVIPFKTWMKSIASIAAAMLIVVVLIDASHNGGKGSAPLDRSKADMKGVARSEVMESAILSDDIEANKVQEAEAPMLKRAAEDSATSESVKDSKVQASEEPLEEWEITTSEKEKIIAAIKDYGDKNNLQPEYLPNEKDVSSIILYKIQNKDELLEGLYKIEPKLQITKKEEGGENLKIIIK